MTTDCCPACGHISIRRHVEASGGFHTDGAASRFSCRDCGHRFDEPDTVDDDANSRNNTGGSPHVERLLDADGEIHGGEA